MKLADDHDNPLKDYCYNIVNADMERAVRRNYKSKAVLLGQGILSEERIVNLPNLGENCPKHNRYSNTFYRTTTQVYSTSELIIPVQGLDYRFNSRSF